MNRSVFGYDGQYGYREDADSGLKLLGHRLYDPSVGRFLTRDPVKDGRNWYAYCDGNPASSVDPLGLSWWSDGWEWISDKLYSWQVFTEWLGILKPVAAGLASGLVVGSIWILAKNAHGDHAAGPPKHGPVYYPGIPDRPLPINPDPANGFRMDHGAARNAQDFTDPDKN